MLSYCLKCRENTQSKNSEGVKKKTKKNSRIMLLSKCSVCNSKKLKFLKEKEARGLLGSLGIRTPLSQIPLLDPLLF